MKIDFYGVYRLSAGQKTIEVDFDGSLRDLLSRVVAWVPDLRDELFDRSGNLYAYIPIFLNGRNPRLIPDGFNRAIQANDVLSIFSPIASGRINVEEVNRMPKV